MNLKKWLGSGLLLLTPVAAIAHGIGNTIDGYYVSSDLDVEVDGLGSGDDDGDGFGVKGTFAFADSLFFNAEYQSVTYDDSDIDLDQARAGIGVNSAPINQFVFYGLAEYVNVDLDGEDEDGFGIHGGAVWSLNEMVSFNGRLGYVDLGDADGLEWLVGAAVRFTPHVGAFVDYRASNQGDDGIDIDTGDLRIGARFIF